MTESPPLRLTDEELVLLGGDHHVVALPFLDVLEPDARSVAMTVAQRALFAHGAMAEDGSIGVPEQILDLLRCRREADASLVLIASDLRRDLWAARYLHCCDGFFVVEDVSADGVHEFGIAAPAAVDDVVRDWIVPLEPLAAQGNPMRVLDAAEPWGDCQFRLDATLHLRGGPRGRLIGVLGGTRGSWLTDVAPQQPGEVELEPVDLDRIVHRIVTLLPTVGDDACAGPAGPGGTMTA